MKKKIANYLVLLTSLALSGNSIHGMGLESIRQNPEDVFFDEALDVESLRMILENKDEINELLEKACKNTLENTIHGSMQQPEISALAFAMVLGVAATDAKTLAKEISRDIAGQQACHENEISSQDYNSWLSGTLEEKEGELDWGVVDLAREDADNSAWEYIYLYWNDFLKEWWDEAKELNPEGWSLAWRKVWREPADANPENYSFRDHAAEESYDSDDWMRNPAFWGVTFQESKPIITTWLSHLNYTDPTDIGEASAVLSNMRTLAWVAKHGAHYFSMAINEALRAHQAH